MRSRGFTWLIVLVTALLLLVPSAAVFYTDWLWFKEVGYDSLFLRRINAQGLVFIVVFTAVFVVLSFNLRYARRALNRPQIVLGTSLDGRSIAIDSGRLTGLGMLVTMGIALLIGISAASNWLMWLSYFNAEPFGTSDALFGRDVSFYVFTLPAFRAARQIALITLVLSLIGAGLYYVLSGSFVLEQRSKTSFVPRVRLIPTARRHLGILGALIFVLVAFGAWLDLSGMLTSPASPAVGYGVSYADAHARIPFLWVQIVVLLAGAVLAIVYGFSRLGWPLALAVGSYFAVVVVGGLYAAFLQRVVVTPNELEREQPYIRHNIEATRKAYGLDGVVERQISGDAELSAQDIISNAATVENVRLWDHQPLLQTFGQIQEIRTYYDFNSVDNDRYVINGKLRQVMLSAREMNTDSLPQRTWVNERLTYTHGYGLTLGPVNQVTTEGLPVLFLRDLPPVSTADLRVDQPSLYYGEMPSDYSIVRSKQPEFHYPREADDDYETTSYDGTGGVPIGGLMRRLMFALRFASTDILFTDRITAESRILFKRRITERTHEIAPFLMFDRDPYLVVADGKLFWIQDAYTRTSEYPYSTPVASRQSGPSGSFNYIRNSVKIVIDAFHGSVTFYLADPADPLARTIQRVFPALFKPLSEMPESLKQHVRYPEDIFQYQAWVFQSYHMTAPQIFYAKEDQWQVPQLEVDRTSVPMQPYYTIMRLPGEKHAEFIQMLPFTPRLKDNLSAWMVARSDGANYGKLMVFQFPKQKIVYGPKQIVGRINQDEVISQQVTLWDQAGSQVIWGTLLVIPVNESLLYVRPLYLRAAEGRIPELKRVIVAYQNRIVMKETLTQGLAEIFGPSVSAALAPDRLSTTGRPVTGASPGTVLPTPAGAVPVSSLDPATASLYAEMRTHFNRAEEALKQGNLALFEQEYKRAKAVLDRLENGCKGGGAPPPRHFTRTNITRDVTRLRSSVTRRQSSLGSTACSVCQVSPSSLTWISRTSSDGGIQSLRPAVETTGSDGVFARG
jgi:uncharacterized membrane protein (UPF0182 family)